MANRYWVGGTDSWSGTAGTKWATTSGGAGGAAEPTSSDAVFFDANSGAVVVTIGSGSACLSLNCTGFVGTLQGTGVSGGSVAISGNLTLGSGMTLQAGVNGLSLGFNATASVTSNGVVLQGTDSGYFFNTGANVTLADDLATDGDIDLNGGTLNFSNRNVTAGRLDAGGSTTRTLTMGSGTLTMTGAGTVLSTSGSNITVNTDTCTLKMTNNSASSKTFAGAGRSYHRLWIATAGAGVTTISGDNTFATLSIDPGREVRLTAGSTQVVTTPDFDGTSGNLVKLLSSSAGNAWTISKSSGLVDADYLDLKDSIATGGATWNAGANSVDSGNNVGWLFSSAGGGAHRMFAVF